MTELSQVVNAVPLAQHEHPDFHPQFDGLRASYLAVSGAVVVKLYSGACQQYSERVLTSPDCGLFKQHALLHFAEAMCHAVNAGVSYDEVKAIVDNSARVVEAAKINDEGGMQVFGMSAVGLLRSQRPVVQYVLAGQANDTVILVTPDVHAKSVSVSELLQEVCRETVV